MTQPNPAKPAGESAPAEPATNSEVVTPADVVALPADAMLLHIGIHKTGTTALQSTLRQERTQLAQHGVTYPKTTDGPALAVRSLQGNELGWEPTKSLKELRAIWNRFASEVRPLTGRVLISTESFCTATDKDAAKIVRDLGSDRVHVVVGIRAFGPLLTSSWQQYLKTGRSMQFEGWLREVLADPPTTTSTPSFWRRNDIPRLLERWSHLVGSERMTVIITDPVQRATIPDTFERLLDLPPGLLGQATASARSNRSLSAAEAELLRRVNQVARAQLSSVEYNRVVRQGGAVRLVESRVPEPEEPRLVLPSWTLEPIASISQRHVTAIHDVRASGATVVGNVEDLLRAPHTDDALTPTLVPIDAAAAFMLGSLLQAPSPAKPASHPDDEASAGPNALRRTAERLPPSIRRRLRRRRRR